jgi:hypothetical protein
MLTEDMEIFDVLTSMNSDARRLQEMLEKREWNQKPGEMPIRGKLCIGCSESNPYGMTFDCEPNLDDDE